MKTIDLKYGQTVIPFNYDPARFELIENASSGPPLTDAAIGQKLDSPIDGPSLEDAVVPGRSVLIVVPDATRNVACGRIVNLIVRRLIANGTAVSDIKIIFATGIHRPVTEAEKAEILTEFIATRIKTEVHDAYDGSKLVDLGKICGDIPLRLNRALLEHDHVILIGGISFHYFAGFTGGRKLICPGLAGAETIVETHNLAFDPQTKTRREGVGTALLAGNAVHEAFAEAASKVATALSINTIVNDAGELADVFCGGLLDSHLAACEVFAANHTARIKERRPLVIASCGGDPYDINVIQAHKTLEAASKACSENGTIVLLAECREGMGRADFLKWFESSGPADLAEKLSVDYEVNGQTAWSLWSKTKNFDVRLISSIAAADAEKMGMTPMQSLARIISKLNPQKPGYIVPSGGKVRILCDDQDSS